MRSYDWTSLIKEKIMPGAFHVEKGPRVEYVEKGHTQLNGRDCVRVLFGDTRNKPLCFSSRKGLLDLAAFLTRLSQELPED